MSNQIANQRAKLDANPNADDHRIQMLTDKHLATMTIDQAHSESMRLQGRRRNAQRNDTLHIAQRPLIGDPSEEG